MTGLGKNAQIDGRWCRVSLTKEEKDRVLEQLRLDNLSLFDQCMKDSQKFNVIKGKVEYEFRIAGILFDKMATASFTALSDAVEQKVHDLKNPGYTPVKAEITPEMRKKIEEAQKPPKLNGKSKLDEIYEKEE